MRTCLFTLLCLCLCAPDRLLAEGPSPLSIGEFFERLAVRSKANRPGPLVNPSNCRQVQVALVIDATTSMQQEIESIAERLPALGRLLSPSAPGASGDGADVLWSVVLFRDTDAPSGPVSILETGRPETLLVMGKLSTVKVETNEPFPNNCIDVGMAEAINTLSWKSEADVAKHLILIGDSPAYGGGTEFRKHSTDQLIEMAKAKGIRVHAIHPAFIGDVTPEMTEARKLTNRFYAMVTQRLDGFHIDLNEVDHLRACLGRTVSLPGFDAATIQKLSSAPQQIDGAADEASWARFALRHARSVQDQRELRDALELIWTSVSPRHDDAARRDLLRGIGILDAIAADAADNNAALHLQLALAHDRLAEFDQYDHHASERSRHAWLAFDQATRSLSQVRQQSQPQDLSPSCAGEIEAWKKLHVDGDSEGALAAFEKVIGLGDESNNPGALWRSHWACLGIRLRSAQLSLASDSDEQPGISAIREDLDYLVLHAPSPTHADALRKILGNVRDGRLWLHEDQFNSSF